MNKEEHKATSRVLDILELLAEKTDGLSLTEIAQELRAPKSSLLPILRTMCDRNFLCLSAEDRNHYRIAYQTFIVGSAYGRNKMVLSFLRQQMREMVEDIREIAQFAVLSGGNVYYLLRVENDNPITLRSQVDNMLPAYCTGVGKALLSGLSMDEIRMLYPNGLTVYTPNTIHSFDLLEEHLREINRVGFAYEHGELVPGVECVATPICSGEHVVAAASFAIPDYRMDDEKRDRARFLLGRFRAAAEECFAKLNIVKGSDLI